MYDGLRWNGETRGLGGLDYVQRLTMDELKQNYRDAMRLLEREKDSLLPGMKQKLVWSVSAQMVLFPLMKAESWIISIHWSL